jgi:hypothetical protein
MTAKDVWFFVREDGVIIKRIENDGWAYLRDGPQATDTIVTVEYVKTYYPDYYEHYLKKKLT